MSLLAKLTEGISHRSMRKEGAALLEKWQSTGLLEGLKSDRSRANMARLLENQAKELLREASTMQSGDVEGFAAVAFPLVRRVFGELIAEKLVSVQPMSLPSGLIFFLDFKYTFSKSNAGAVAGESIYGGGVVGSQITGGVNLTDDGGAEKGFYALNNGYTSPSGTVTLTYHETTLADNKIVPVDFAGGTSLSGTAITNYEDQASVRHDVDVLGDNDNYYRQYDVQLSAAEFAKVNLRNLIAIDVASGSALSGSKAVRRLTTVDVPNRQFSFTFRNATDTWLTGSTCTMQYAHADQFTTGNGLGSVKGTDEWYLEALYGTTQDIPELDIKIDSISVTAITKKLKAKWTPELGQDLDAYHNLDAEVELTGIISEQVALEIDAEIITELIQQGTAATYYWSRIPGKFVKAATGEPLDTDPTTVASYPDFTGTVSAWYETLIERINDVSAQIHRKTLKGGATWLLTSPEVANIMEFTNGFRADVTADKETGTAGVFKSGTINKKWDVFVSAYMPRNLVLIGRKGTGFLETGCVYAPYVPFQTTPTLFDPEDGTPRKIALTRYAKKTVRPDFFGKLVVMDMLGGTAHT